MSMMDLRIPTIIQLTTASISVIASATIAIMIQRLASGGLSTPYRRLIFCLSCADLIQSSALVVGPLAPPTGTPQSPWAHGNAHTCNANGFFFTVGSLAVPLYTCSLCIYYLCKIKYGMSNSSFTNRIEKKLHALIIVACASVSIGALVNKNFNAVPTGSFCYIAAIPAGCRRYAEYVGECVRGKDAVAYTMIATIAVPFLCLVGITLSMTMLCWHVISRERFLSSSSYSNAGTGGTGRCRCGCRYIRIFQERQVHEPEANYLQRLYKGEVMLQASLYVGGFFLTYCLTWVVAVMNLLGVIPSTGFLYALPLLFPLGGMFNILVYTRPKIGLLRRRYSDYSWFKAFWLVLKAGGELPETTRDESSNDNDETGLRAGCLSCCSPVLLCTSWSCWGSAEGDNKFGSSWNGVNPSAMNPSDGAAASPNPNGGLGGASFSFSESEYTTIQSTAEDGASTTSHTGTKIVSGVVNDNNVVECNDDESSNSMVENRDEQCRTTSSGVISNAACGFPSEPSIGMGIIEEEEDELSSAIVGEGEGEEEAASRVEPEPDQRRDYYGAVRQMVTLRRM